MFASLSSLIINIVNKLYSSKGKEPKTTSPVDFMLKWGDDVAQKPEPKTQSVDEMKQILMGIASVQGEKKKMR